MRITGVPSHLAAGSGGPEEFFLPRLIHHPGQDLGFVRVLTRVELGARRVDLLEKLVDIDGHREVLPLPREVGIQRDKERLEDLLSIDLAAQGSKLLLDIVRCVIVRDTAGHEKKLAFQSDALKAAREQPFNLVSNHFLHLDTSEVFIHRSVAKALASSERALLYCLRGIPAGDRY